MSDSLRTVDTIITILTEATGPSTRVATIVLMEDILILTARIPITRPKILTKTHTIRRSLTPIPTPIPMLIQDFLIRTSRFATMLNHLISSSSPYGYGNYGGGGYGYAFEDSATPTSTKDTKAEKPAPKTFTARRK